MADRTIAFRLPITGWPRAVFETDYGLRGGRLVTGDTAIASASDRAELISGIEGVHAGARVAVRLDGERVLLTVDGRPAPREDELRARPSRSAWIHAALALAGSFAGFVASYLYLDKADLLADPWSHKMGVHMAVWHLILTVTLFPSSVWGQRIGIRIVQGVCVVFFCIHAGIAIANIGPTDLGIAVLNGASGLLFLIAAGYGSRAWRDMDPIAALRRATEG